MATRGDGGDTTSDNPRAPVHQRLHDGFRADRRYLSKMVVEAQDERANRIEAVLELKQDLDTSSARIAAQSSAIRAQEQAEKAHQARTHQSLLDQGKNPYEVARRKVVKRDAKRERSKIERNVQDREAKLLARLEAEKTLQRKRDKVEAENRAYERKYQREMGRAAQEERTNAYLLSRTGKEALDPTGKLVRAYPSQETTIKDYTFGLGRSAVLSPEHRRRVIAKVLAKPAHSGTQPTSILLPRWRGHLSQQESEGFEGLAASSGRSEDDVKENNELKNIDRLVMPPLPGVKPGQELRKVNHVLLPSSGSDVKLPPIAGMNTQSLPDSRQEDEENQTAEDTPNSSGSSSKHKNSRGRSVLDERQLAKARQRQKDARFAQEQVVWGKAFTGNAFLPSPQMLWFKDFDVGRPLTLSFTLTNISNTFHQFRLLPMDDEVIELFDIVYEKPGRMSAGMSCSLRMTFRGMKGRDLDTTLSVAAPMGIFQIPVRCTCKKAVPVLLQREIRFPEVVAGERTTVALTLNNDGARPLEYRVRRLPSESIGPLQAAAPDNLPAASAPTEKEEVAGVADESCVEGDATSTDPEIVDDGIADNPQEDNGEQSVEETTDVNNEVAQEETRTDSGLPSCATSAASTKTSATRSKFPEETAREEENDEAQDPLTLEEQELVERVGEVMRFKPDGADEPVRFTKRGTVQPYSSSAISFTFAPAAAMKLENEQFLLEFPAASSSGLSSPDLRRLATIPVLASGVASQVPVFVAQSKLNFRCCAYGKLYRHQLVVCNRGKVALKMQVQVPKPLAGYVEFNPSFGFVQAAVASQEGQFPVQIKFRPEERMWKRIERAGFGSRELGMLAVPVSVVVPDQVVPVFFLLTARLTATMLQIDIQPENSGGGLHFGTCCVGHSVSQELTITNSARVPQRIGVTKVPKDVTVADISSGVGVVLLPGETRSLRVVYAPSFPGALKASGPAGRSKPILSLWSSTFHQEYVLPCLGSGVASDLSFSHTAVRLGATSIGQTQTCNLKLMNRSDRYTHCVELRLPPEVVPFLRITPLVVRLLPQETVRLEIDFEPTKDIFKLAENGFFKAKDPESSGSTNEESTSDPSSTSARRAKSEMTPKQSGGPASTDVFDNNDSTPVPTENSEPRSCHRTWTVLCFHQREYGVDEKRPAKSEELTPLQALEVRTTVVEPILTPSTNSLDFGQVAIGQTLVRELTLELSPVATGSVKLRAQPLHILGAFRLIGALREVPAIFNSRKRHTIRVEFEPRTPLKYEDELELSALGVNIRVRLRGEGINPSLSLNPADGKLDFQDVLARTRNVCELVLSNGSAFPLAFSLVPIDEHADIVSGESSIITTSTGLPVFTFSPTSAIIPENGSVSVQVVFQPDHQRPGHYAQQYRIKVPNESEHHVVSVAGRCWENQLYVFAPTAEPSTASTEGAATWTNKPPLLTRRPVEDLFDLPPSISLNQLPLNVGVSELPPAGLRKPPSTFTLTFAADDAVRNSRAGDTEFTDTPATARITKTLFIGSTAPSSGTYGGFDEAATAAAMTGGSAGSFELTVDAASPHAKLFTLEPSRGAVAAGQQLAVQVTYYPPALTTASAFGSDATPASASARTSGVVASTTTEPAKRRPEYEVVQWVQVRVQCTLKGGSLWCVLPAIGGTPVPAPVAATGSAHQPPKGANTGAVPDGVDTRNVTVILRARLET